MATLTQPLINGFRYQFSNIEIDIDGDVITEVTSIDYEHKLEPGETRGTGSVYATGRTTGEYTASGKIELPIHVAAALRARLGKGYLRKPFPITVSYADEGQPVITDRLFDCRMTGESNSHSNGTDGLVESIDLHIMRVQKNGVDPV
jgi:hypothetical protein